VFWANADERSYWLCLLPAKATTSEYLPHPKSAIAEIQFPSRIPVRSLHQLQNLTDNLAKISVMVLTQRKSPLPCYRLTVSNSDLQ
jgi:hypothetical protein